MGDAQPLDFAALKRGGIMRQVEPGRFSLRLHVVAGSLDSAKLRAVAEAADRYGRGEVHLTARQGVEIPHVLHENIGDVRRALAAVGLELGACGPRVRTVTGCQGAAVCPHGLVETGELCMRIDREFAGQELPHKLKFGVSGCVNSCIKPQENDIGVMGAVEPTIRLDDCNGCMVCESVCETGALTEEDGFPRIDAAKCSLCGECIAACPTDTIAGRRGYALHLGGRIGRHPKLGERFGGLVPGMDELFRAFHALLALYRAKGRRSERFGAMLDRLDRASIESLVEGALRGASTGSAA